MKVIEYHVICREDIKDVVYDVNCYIANGWEPLGGIAIYTAEAHITINARSVRAYYLQSMVRKGL